LFLNLLKHTTHTLFFIGAFIFLTSCQNQKYPVAAVDPIKNITVVEDHSEVLVQWMKAGYEDMVLINVDHHDDFRPIPEHKMMRLKNLYDDKKWDEIVSSRDKGAHSLYVLADFIYAAYRLGIVKKLYWVATSGFLDYEDIEKGGRAFLRSFGYPDDVIASFRKSGQALSGTIYGLEVVISSMKNLPGIKEPVLFTIDSDYFPNRMEKKDEGELQAMMEFFYHLRNRNVRVKHLSISYSVNGDYTPVIDKHMTDEIAHLFSHPEIIDNQLFPELWKVRDRGFGLLRNNLTEDAFTLFSDSLTVFPGEPTVVLGKATSLSLMGKDDDAFNVMDTLLQDNPEYDYFFIYMGKVLGEKKQLERARRYFDEYLRLHPDSFYGLISYGDILYANARDDEALKMYQKVIAQGDYVNAIMYAGDALFHLKRYQEALTYYEKGLRLLNEVGYRSVRNYPESVRNMSIINKSIRGNNPSPH